MDWSKEKLGGNSRQPQLKDKVEMLDLQDGAEFKLTRMIGPSKKVAKHLLPVFKNDGTPVIGKNKQQVRIPKVCLSFNHLTGEHDRKAPNKEGKMKLVKCPYCDMDPDGVKVEVHTNVIDREIEDDFNAKKARKRWSKKESKKREMTGGSFHIADSKASKKLTPLRFQVIKASIGGKISDFTALNKKKDKEGKVRTYGPNHPKYGFDMNLKFDSKKPGTEMYGCVKDERKPITDEEMEYLFWDIDIDAPEDFKTATKEAESFAKRIKAGEKAGHGSDDDEDDDDDDKKSKKSKGKKGKKNKAEEDDWDADEDMEDDDDDDGKKSKKSKKKSKKSDEDDDGDDDDDSESDDDDSDDDESDDDDEDEEDDDEPKKKGKKDKKGKKSKKSKSDDDDEDDDSDDEDEDESDDDDDDEPKSKKKGKKKSKSDDDEDEDDEDSDEDEEDDDDEPVKKKKNKDKKKSKKSSDDDDDEDEDDEDEDEDEPKSKKSKKKDKKSDKKKKKSKKEDDDDDDDDDSDWDDD